MSSKKEAKKQSLIFKILYREKEVGVLNSLYLELEKIKHAVSKQALQTCYETQRIIEDNDNRQLRLQRKIENYKRESTVCLF